MCEHNSTNSLCITRYFYPHKAVEDLMGEKHKDVVRRERIATDREHRQTKLHPTNTVYTKHSGIGSFFKDMVLSPF